ncbi:hypothetical protein [Candidatus Ichthyocystis hellenicum]|uniref:hypothetical protein n=1 Tax=Candidatus Ichthyocystis hellenicum TaxID=1561003 RepID=UPI000B884F1E|nr:hypothetical protein [Candidatus Ichthyocystis hellenicum]
MCQIPKTICVDLDGTLIAEDVGRIALSRLIYIPWKDQFRIASSIIHGYTLLKHKLSKFVHIDPSSLTYNDNLISWLVQKKTEGHDLILASASQSNYVETIFDHIKIFDDYHASDDKTHLIGEKKGRYLAEKYGINQFVYCGNSWVDLGVWKYSSHAVVVNIPPIIKAILRRKTNIIQTFDI